MSGSDKIKYPTTRTTTPERLRAASWRTRSSLGSRCGCFPQLCSRRHAVHARTLLYAQFANKRSTPHRYHTAASPWPVSRTFQLGGLGVRSHNFCEVVTSAKGVTRNLSKARSESKRKLVLIIEDLIFSTPSLHKSSPLFSATSQTVGPRPPHTNYCGTLTGEF